MDITNSSTAATTTTTTTTTTTQTNNNIKKVKLLLHAEDGSVPFLTPYILENYFPAKSQWIQDHLVIGLAVKDTCVTPIFQRKGNGDGNSGNGGNGGNGNGESENTNTNGNGNEAPLSNNEKKKRKRKQQPIYKKRVEGEITSTSTSTVGEESDGAPATKRQCTDDGSPGPGPGPGPGASTDHCTKNKSECNTCTGVKINTNSNTNTMKPTGYSFSHHQTHDILPGYHSITVPTFDLVDDITNFAKSKRKNKQKKTKKNSKNDMNANANTNTNTNNHLPDSDSDVFLPPIPATNNHVTLCTPHGMQKLDVKTYIKIVMNESGPGSGSESGSRYLKSSMSIVGLYDQVHMNDRKKRKMNCMERTKLWMEKLMKENNRELNLDIGAPSSSPSKSECASIEKRKIWAPFLCNVTAGEEGGGSNGGDGGDDGDGDDTRTVVGNGSTANFFIPFDVKLQSVLCQEKNIAGVAMVGLHHIPSRHRQIQFLQQCSKALQSTPTSSLGLAVLVTKNLKQILDVTRFGVSMFGCDLPSQWARSGKSLALSINRKKDDSNGTNGILDLVLDENGCIDLSSDEYCRDKRPLLLGCQCPSCRDTTYTRAYVHHLIKANELLGDILLFGHNLYQMLLLCKEFSIACNDGTIDQYCEFIENQLS